VYGRNPVWMLNPQSNNKRRTVGQRLTARGHLATDFSVQAVKERLKAIRIESADQLEGLVEQLAQTCHERYGITPFHADTAKLAAQYVLEVAMPYKRVEVNRSATVNEMRPALLECGLTVVDSYDEEFEHPEDGIEYYWELEIPEPEGAWESFAHPRPAPRPSITDNTVAVIGVNTISAADGAAYLVEHLRNITRLLRQAKMVVLVVALDKIAPTAADARFVAQAMGLFGAPSVAMTASSRGRTGSEADDVERPPTERSHTETGTGQEWHVILLDNKRRWLLDSPFASLFTCIGCRACLRECPTYPYLGENPGLSPRDQLWRALRGDGDSSANCVSCGRCKVLCPVGIDLPLMLSEVKARSPKLRDQFFKRIDQLFALSSAAAPVANLAFSLPLVRIPAEWVSSMDRRRALPQFHRQSYVRQMAADNGTAPAQVASPAERPSPAVSTNGRKVAYYYGCYVNYTDPNLGRTFTRLLEKNGFQVAIPRQTCCGVAAYWQGDRKISRDYAKNTMESLIPWVDQGYRIVVTCPSCGLALKQDFLHLFPGDDRAQRLADNTQDASTFILEMTGAGAWTPASTPVDLKVGYHTPCHLRIRGRGQDTLDLLATIPALEVGNVDRGCCGLAGSFGMKAKNYDASMAIGARPAKYLREEEFDAVTTDCAGCEMQLQAVSGLPAYHPLKLLWMGNGERPFDGI
jgi:glycerol-3-phosphate dehydrogenase subunit C